MKTMGVTLLLLVALCAKAQITPMPMGINICGSEFGEDKLPGTLNVDYVYPNIAEINYFAKKGFKVITLPFRWERIQRTLGGELDAREVAEIKKFIVNCNERGLKVILSMHNFGRYKIGAYDYIIGSQQVTRWHYRDVWQKIAETFRMNSNIYGYAIMTEPHDMWNYSWTLSAQEAVNAIREVDIRTNIIVGGDNYSCSEEWVAYNDDLKRLKDPFNKIIFDAHCYFDEDHSGRYFAGYANNKTNSYTGINRVKPFIDWLKKNNKKGIIGEFGVPAYDSRWLTVMDNFLQFANANGINVNYWAAGPWWSNYQLSIEPTAYGNDKPQMAVLQKYISGSSDRSSYTINTKNIESENSSEISSEKNNILNKNKTRTSGSGNYAIISAASYRYVVSAGW
jgi:endoglucanase